MRRALFKIFDGNSHYSVIPVTVGNINNYKGNVNNRPEQ